MIIVSFTTIPPRFKYIYMTIDSMLKQTISPNKIIIHIPNEYNNFPNYKLPEFLNKCEIIYKNKVIINRQTNDYGPATKLLGLYNSDLYKNLSNEDIIIIIDDDRFYNKYLIENMLYYHKKNKNKVLTIAGWEIETVTKNHIKTKKRKKPRGKEFKNEGYIDILGGCCGFLITKGLCPFNNKEIFNINHKDVKYYVDDILISGFLTVNNTDIYIIPNKITKEEFRTNNDTINELCDNTRKQKNIKCIEYFKNNYKIWK